MNEFRTTLSEELSSLTPPPLGDLVGDATRRGRRARRLRTVGAAAGSVAALATVSVLLTGLLGGSGDGAAQTVAAAPATDGGGLSAAAPQVVPPPSGGSSQVPATDPALLAAVLHALPADQQSSHYAASTDKNPGVQVYLSNARGTGMVRVMLADATQTGHLKCGDGCQTDARGQHYRVTNLSDNCIAETNVFLEHADGTIVHVQLSTCLAWDGTGNAVGIRALTVDQAVQLAGQPWIANQMDLAFVQAAQAQFPSLPTFS